MAAAGPTATSGPISIVRYLRRSTFRPDVDFVDGRLVGRNIGEVKHGRLVGELCFMLGSKEEEWSIIGLISVRIYKSLADSRPRS